MAEQALSHKLTLDDRKKLTMTGVTEVVSFDENTVTLLTNLGTLVIQGSQLQLKNLSLDGGEAAVEGHIESLIYEEPRYAQSWLRRFLG